LLLKSSLKPCIKTSFLKYQTETEITKKRKINELRAKIDNIKEEVTHGMENLRKKNETELQNKMEVHSSTIE
jgi:hypothetical protein